MGHIAGGGAAGRGRAGTLAKRSRIETAAMRLFAERGYAATRVEDVARSLGIAKGSVFQHFGGKEGLFLAAYKRAVASLPSYADTPAEVQGRGFFATVRYWLTRTGHLLHEDWIPYRVTLLGNYGTDLALKREINRFLLETDPYGSAALVRGAIARGELRADVDAALIVAMVDWTLDRFQDALLTEELDPGIFRRGEATPEKTRLRVEQFIELLRGAIGARRVGRRRASKTRARLR